MKKDIHPKYRPVVFKDVSSGVSFVTRSTIRTEDKVMHEGVEYPLYKVNVSSTSHPFYTGQRQFMDTAGRVEKFKKRYTKK